jgi:DNA-directed RNA polymerase subunit RPC12/RpoP
MPEQIQPKLVKCQKCGYEWWTRSKLMLVTCPSCGHKVRREAGSPEKKP